jgi:hypothetical protein
VLFQAIPLFQIFRLIQASEFLRPSQSDDAIPHRHCGGNERPRRLAAVESALPSPPERFDPRLRHARP